MIDLSKLKYRVVVMDESKNQYNINDYIENLGWEENENEIAVRVSFTVKNDKTSKGYLSGIIKPGCLIGIFASDGSTNQEVARGYVEVWEHMQKNGGDTLRCTAYDELYKLQKSQDNRYYPAGTGTQSAITAVLDDWELPQDSYKGPNVSHAKMVFNNRYLSDIILELLDDASKKGSEKCMIRAAAGKTAVLLKGSNTVVYVFRIDNTIELSESISTSELITRVRVVGQADDNGVHSVEALLDGMTQYGIRQRIYTRRSDETPADAKSAAQEILNGEGKIEKTMSIQSPDVPFIRRGDLVYIISGLFSDYFYVKSLQHNIDSFSMSMQLELAEQEAANSSENETITEKEYKEGDIVNFHGGTHYVSSYPDAKGYGAGAGPARITKKNGSGGAHPWHLIHADSSSNVYGWVDNDTFD